MDGNARAVLGLVERRIRGYGASHAMVAFSGGVDSAVVLAAARWALGTDRVTAVTAVSPSYPRGELDQARAVSAGMGVRHRVVRTREVDRESYARNDGQRCFHCKVELYGTVRRMAGQWEDAGDAHHRVVLAGANADDAGDYRPGLRAGEGAGVRNPLLEEGLGKEAVRGIARLLGLSIAEKPAMACLSSRVAFGVRISPALLRRIDRAESAVRALGFPVVRVRHFGARAVIEVSSDQVDSLLGHPGLPELERRLAQLGWDRVDVDPAGYRTGNMNATLPAAQGGPPRR